MQLIREDKTGIVRIKNRFADRIKHPIAEPSFEHADDAPYAGFGAMLPAQPGR